MNSDILRQFKAARKCSVPILAISSPDQQATVRALNETLGNGSAVFMWNLLSGFVPMNKAAETNLHKLRGDGDDDPSKLSPTAAVQEFTNHPVERAILFMVNAHRFLDEAPVMQAVANCRDILKGDGRTLVLLGPSVKMPPEISGDVVILDEPLPTAEQLTSIAKQSYEDAGRKIDKETTEKAVEAVQGLPAFQAEQAIALAIVDKDPIDIGGLWEHKRKQIEATPGLRVWRDGVRFDGIGGVPRIKKFMRDIVNGNGRPRCIVFIDEIEKMMAGASGDTSGVSQDQLGVLLEYMEDNRAAGAIFVGPPGASKSMVAKATGNEAGVPTIKLDLGATKGSLVGQSEQTIRAALKVITAVSSGSSLWIATSNRLTDIKSELKRRFNLGVFFFDLPDDEERKVIWEIQKKAYGIKQSHKDIEDEGWTGANIRDCCEIAWRLNGSLTDAASYVIPVTKSDPTGTERLRADAAGKFLSASHEGTYSRTANVDAVPANKGRRFDN